MREIKFRAWDKLNKKWLEFGFLDFDGEFLQDCQGGGLEKHDCKDYKLMQFTGLKDKNGVEIYEGDIVKADKRNYKGIVEFKQGFFGVDEAGFRTLNWFVNFDIEVIGNIYKSPELLN